ncbi:MAG: leucyl/phenylalanyl-tRNA--protein transferase [Cyclobacteriaceae bacterium]
MPIYLLTEDLVFPPVEGAVDGIVAIGGDLSPERLVLAYQSGIFPWYSAGDPITWWSMDPRFVLYPDRLHTSRSMKAILRREEFSVTFNQNFPEVINHCKSMPRNGQGGTWITDEMREAYVRLHELGHAKSVEVWKNSELVGGMYGIDLGSVFCGESMFSKVSNASKVALIMFIRKFKEEGGRLFDCQVHTDHLESMGAEEIPRSEFLRYLK